MYLLFLLILNTFADNSIDICNSINSIRIQRGLIPFIHSNLLKKVSEAHLDNLIGNTYDPFADNNCDPHSWFENTSIGVLACCYPRENCMGNKGRLFSGGAYTGITIENLYATRRTGGFFGGGVTGSGITANSVVRSWENSPGHLAAIVSNNIICGGGIAEYSQGVTFTGIAVAWFGSTIDQVIPPITLVPTSRPSLQPTLQPTSRPSLQPTPHPSLQPTPRPSLQPTPQPSLQPISTSTLFPTRRPSAQPISTTTLVPTPDATQISTLEPTFQPTPVSTLLPIICVQNNTVEYITHVYCYQWMHAFMVSIGYALGILSGILACAILQDCYKKDENTPRSRDIELQPHFSNIIKGMLDPNDPDDAELLAAKNSHAMYKIIHKKHYPNDMYNKK